MSLDKKWQQFFARCPRFAHWEPEIKRTQQPPPAYLDCIISDADLPPVLSPAERKYGETLAKRIKQ